MRLDGFGLFVEDMAKMIRFYRDVLGFEIKESEDTSNVYLVKDGTLFLLYGRKDFENMTHRRYEYIKGLNGHSEIALYVDTFEEVDMAYNNAIKNGVKSCSSRSRVKASPILLYKSGRSAKVVRLLNINLQSEENRLKTN